MVSLFAVASWLCLYFKWSSQAKWLMASLCSKVSFGHFPREPGEKKCLNPCNVLAQAYCIQSAPWVALTQPCPHVLGLQSTVTMIHGVIDGKKPSCVSFPRQPDLICTRAVGDREGSCAEGAARAGCGQLPWATGGGLARGSGSVSCPSPWLCKRDKHNQCFSYTEPVFNLGFATGLYFKHLLHESLFSHLKVHLKSCFSHSSLF